MTTAPPAADVVVVGAGLVGAACAAWLARTGRSVRVVERTVPTGGTSAAGEGNVLVSDKPPGPELTLALRSVTLWRQAAAQGQDAGRFGFELETKGGLVVAHDGRSLAALRAFARAQHAAGVVTALADAAGVGELEPHASPGLAGGVLYPQDCQVQPMLAVRAFLDRACRAGATLTTRCEVLGAQRSPSGALTAVVTSHGTIRTSTVVNAAGPWSSEVAARLGGTAAVRPRRGHILVTEPLPRLIRHKVYEADYVGTVSSDEAALACSAVVEGTASGTVLLGSSRELVGFDTRPSARALSEIARRAITLFPFLWQVRILRSYLGFRPATPDHLPLIGADANVPGLYHATGHEGAGIGLAPATAELVTALISGEKAAVDPAPFAPTRFAGA